MTVPFDPKVSFALVRMFGERQTLDAITQVVACAGVAELCVGYALTAEAHGVVSGIAKDLHTAADTLSALSASIPVLPMADGDLWYCEPSVMTAADLGIEEGGEP